MNLEKYKVVSDDNHIEYHFLSEGPMGVIKKIVIYEEIEESIFNLAFGDFDEIAQKLNDKIRTNNNDRDKVLATVESTVIDFINYHPNAMILVKGFTPSRTRLYQMGIGANLDEITKLFDIDGFTEGVWKVFEKGKNYSSLSLKLK